MMYNLKMRNKFIFLALSVLFLSGCARIVTDKSLTDSSGRRVTVTEARFAFTFAAPPAQNIAQNYYLIISTENLTLAPNRVHPYTAGAMGKYFVAPENTYLVSANQNLLDDYYGVGSAPDINLDEIYAAYFNYWTSYYRYNTVGLPLLYQAPFVSANAPVPTIINRPVSVQGNTLFWTINLPQNYRDFYFALVAVQNTIEYTDSVLEESQVGVNSTRHLFRSMPGHPALREYTVEITEY